MKLREQLFRMKAITGQLVKEYYHEEEDSEKTYWGSMGAGIVPICAETGRALIGLRSSAVMEPNTWGGFGGKIDDDMGETSPANAATREMEEELGYSGSVRLIPGFIYRDGQFSYHNFIGLVDREFRPRLNWENEDAQWLTYDEVMALPNKHYGLVAFFKNSQDLFQKFMV